MKLRNMLFLSFGLLIAAPQGLLAMSKEEQRLAKALAKGSPQPAAKAAAKPSAKSVDKKDEEKAAENKDEKNPEAIEVKEEEVDLSLNSNNAVGKPEPKKEADPVVEKAPLLPVIEADKLPKPNDASKGEAQGDKKEVPQEEKKDGDKKPADTRNFASKIWDDLSTNQRIAAGVGAGAATVGAAAVASPSFRTKLKTWFVDPVTNKYNAIKKNGVGELFTLSTLTSGALTGATAYGLYKWYGLTEDERKQKIDQAKTWTVDNKGKLLLGAAGLAAAGLAYKSLIAQSAEKAISIDELPQLNPKLEAWFNKVWAGLKDDQKQALSPELIVGSLFMPNTLVSAPEHKGFVNLVLTAEQKAEFNILLREHNQAVFEDIKKSVAQLYAGDKAVHAKLIALQTPQELANYMESAEAKAALEKATPIVKDAAKVAAFFKQNLILLLEWFKQQEAFAAEIARKVPAQEIKSLYEVQYEEFRNSFNVHQESFLKELGLGDIIVKGKENPTLLQSNEIFTDILNTQQRNVLQALVTEFTTRK